jgi:hypothetical protein
MPPIGPDALQSANQLHSTSCTFPLTYSKRSPIGSAIVAAPVPVVPVMTIVDAAWVVPRIGTHATTIGSICHCIRRNERSGRDANNSGYD